MALMEAQSELCPDYSSIQQSIPRDPRPSPSAFRTILATLALTAGAVVASLLLLLCAAHVTSFPPSALHLWAPSLRYSG